MWVEEHKVERIIGSIAVTEPLQMAVSKLHLNAASAGGIILSITYRTMLQTQNKTAQHTTKQQ
jgi:hypothetical protein